MRPLIMQHGKIRQGPAMADYTEAEKTKLAGISVEATKNRADSLNADKQHTHTTDDITDMSASGKAVATGTPEQGRAGLGLGDVDNTRDVNKRVGSFAFRDTRDAVSAPDNVPPYTGLFEFKLNTSVGNPPKPSHEGYAHVLTTNGWTADGSGGWPTQVSLGGAISFRKGTSETTWGPWLELISTDTTLGATGQSALYPMSQKAVTDAIANIPSVPKSAAYTVTVADKGASIDTSAGVTIPATVFAVGDVIVVTNTSASSISITPDSGVTFRLAGSESTGLRTLAGYGVATFRMVSSNVWFASGAGLS